jgi:hypothetical protein
VLAAKIRCAVAILPAPAALHGRASVVSRHPATIRRVAQSLGAVGLGVNHALNPGALARARSGDLQLAVIDLDVDINASPQSLVEATALACPDTFIVVVAGVDAKRRLLATLEAPQVRHAMPKLGSWLDLPAEQRTFDGPDEQDLAVGLRRLLYLSGKPLGASPYLIEGFSTTEATIIDSAAKNAALTAVMELAEALELSDEKKRRIEIVTEELLLNALYDAPRDRDGRPIFMGLDRRTAVTLDSEMPVRLHYGCDGRNFVVSVTDRWGALQRQSVVDSLRKLLDPRSVRPTPGTSGAGLGLMLTYGASNQLIVHAMPGRFTEVTSVMHVSGSNRTALARGSALHLYLEGRS